MQQPPSTIYESRGKRYEIPDEIKQQFLADRPDAKPINAEPDTATPQKSNLSKHEFLQIQKNKSLYTSPQPQKNPFANIPQREQDTPITRYDQSAAQSFSAYAQQYKIAAANAANLVTESSKDAQKALNLLDQYEAESFDYKNLTAKELSDSQKKRNYNIALQQYNTEKQAWEERNKKFSDRLRNSLPFSKDPYPTPPKDPIHEAIIKEASDKFNKDDPEYIPITPDFSWADEIPYQLIEQAAKTDNPRQFLQEKADTKSWGDKVEAQALKTLATQRETKGFAAWLGGMTPVLSHGLLTIAAASNPYTRPAAKYIGGAAMPAFGAAAIGGTIAEARQYAKDKGIDIPESDILNAGITSGIVTSAAMSLPYSQITKGMFGKFATAKVIDYMAINPVASEEAKAFFAQAARQIPYTRMITAQGAKQFGKHIASGAAAGATIGTSDELLKMLYKQAEDYPNLAQVVQSAAKGAVDVAFISAFLSGPSAIVRRLEHNQRRINQGKVTLARAQDHGIVEIIKEDPNSVTILNTNGETLNIPKANISEVHTVNWRDFKDFATSNTDKNTIKAFDNLKEGEKNIIIQNFKDSYTNLLEAFDNPSPDNFKIPLDDYIFDPATINDYVRGYQTDILKAVLNNKNLSEKQKKAIINYVQRGNMFNAMEISREEKFQQSYERTNEKISAIEQNIDQNINPDTGNITSARIGKGPQAKEVQIIKGKILLDEKGKIDRTQSDQTIYYKDDDGTVKVATIDLFDQLSEDIPRDDAIQAMSKTIIDAESAKLDNEEAITNHQFNPDDFAYYTPEATNQALEIQIQAFDQQSGLYTATDQQGAQIQVEPRLVITEDEYLKRLDNPEIIQSAIRQLDENIDTLLHQDYMDDSQTETYNRIKRQRDLLSNHLENLKNPTPTSANVGGNLQFPPSTTGTAVSNTPPSTNQKIQELNQQRNQEIQNIKLAETRDEINNTRVLETNYWIPFEIIEEAQKRGLGGGQTAKQIADRGGAGISELDHYVPQWRNMLPQAKEINAKYDAQIAALNSNQPENNPTENAQKQEPINYEDPAKFTPIAYAQSIIDGKLVNVTTKPNSDSNFIVAQDKNTGDSILVPYSKAYTRMLANPSFLEGTDKQVTGNQHLIINTPGKVSRNLHSGEYTVRQKPSISLTNNTTPSQSPNEDSPDANSILPREQSELSPDANGILSPLPKAATSPDANGVPSPSTQIKHDFQNFDEARQFGLDNYRGKSYTVKSTGEEISVSRNGIEKALSEKAVNKSVSKDAHLKAFRQLPFIIENAQLEKTHPDKYGDINIDEIRRYETTITIDGTEYNAKTVVKKYIREGSKFYTYEIEEMELSEKRPSSGMDTTQSESPTNSENPIYDDKGTDNILKKQKQAQERARKEAEFAEKQAEGAKAIKNRWDTTPKEKGHTISKTLPNGEVVKGTYILTTQGAATPSHDPSNNFQPSPGFPENKKGGSANDRDYTNPANQQVETLKAQKYDGRAVENTPKVVDGVVIDGNGRVIAGQIAADNNTDKAYIDYLKDNAHLYGFTPDQVDDISKNGSPRLYFELSEQDRLDFTTKNFALFNQRDTKSQDRTELAQKMGKLMTEDIAAKLSAIIEQYENLDAIYRSETGTAALLKALQKNGIINTNDIASLVNDIQTDKTMSEQGQELLETVMIGTVLDTKAVASIRNKPYLRRTVLKAVKPLIANRSLSEDYQILQHLSDAIQRLAKAYDNKEIKPGDRTDAIFRQTELFTQDTSDNIDDKVIQVLAHFINSKRYDDLNKFVSLYNIEAKKAITGQTSLFSNDILTRDDIFDLILKNTDYGIQIINREASTPNTNQNGQQGIKSSTRGNEQPENLPETKQVPDSRIPGEGTVQPGESRQPQQRGTDRTGNKSGSDNAGIRSGVQIENLVRSIKESGKRPTNEQIAEIVSAITAVDEKGIVQITDEITDDIRHIISQYKSGGVAKQGRGILDEYYTDPQIVDTIANSLQKIIFNSSPSPLPTAATSPDANGILSPDANGIPSPDANGVHSPDANGVLSPDAKGVLSPDAKGVLSPLPKAAPSPISVLEPSVGIGNFLSAVPAGSNITAFEINPVTAGIAKILYPEATINLRSFETEFITEKGKKIPDQKKYDLIIGNPPYGEHRGKYKGLGELPELARYEDYFMQRGIHSLKDGGILAMVIPSSWLDRHPLTPYAEILEAYRLPEGSFEATQIGTDIVILKKRDIPNFDPHDYFRKNPDHILGEPKERKNRFGKMEKYISGSLDDALAAIQKIKQDNAISEIQSLFTSGKPTQPTVGAHPRVRPSGKAESLPSFQRMASPYDASPYDPQIIDIIDETPTPQAAAKALKESEKQSNLFKETELFDKQEDKQEEKPKENIDILTLAQQKTTEKKPTNGFRPIKNWKSTKISKGEIRFQLQKDDKTVPLQQQFKQANNITQDQQEAFKAINYAGEFKNGVPKAMEQYANFYDGKQIHDFYYAEGDIYEKLAQLERDESKISPDQYNKQKKLLKSVLPKTKPLSEINISPNVAFVKNINFQIPTWGEDGKLLFQNKEELQIKTEEISLKDLFLNFVQKLPYESVRPSTPYEIREYVENTQVYGSDKERNQIERERRKRAGDELFQRFLNEILSNDARKYIERAYNRQYNAVYRPDYTKAPLFSNINFNFKTDQNGKPKEFKLTPTQQAGIARLSVKGTGLLAHEVGFGKTLSGVLAMNEAMTKGTAKRPLIVVPNNSILKQWVETMFEILPDAKVNILGNMGADYDLTNFTVGEGEISIVTYDGFKRLGFSDQTYDKLAARFQYINDDVQNAKKAAITERERQKTAAKADEKRGKMERNTEFSFEDMGFDHLTFDEVHNANHIVSKVNLEKKTHSDFRGNTQRTSDLGIKTWIASHYIQDMNEGRNVTLLSATPFTNKPLEYYSILSLMGNETLKRMGFFHIDEFFKTFMEAEVDIEMLASGDAKEKMNIRRFKNNGLFEQLLGEYIDIKGELDNPDLIRPERINNDFKVEQNDLTEMAMKAAINLMDDVKTTLKGITHARLIAFSPFASDLIDEEPKDYKDFVTNSPKIKTAIDLIRQNYNDRPDSGQILYSEIGTKFFPAIKEYLIKEAGFKEDQVAIIDGSVKINTREVIKEKYQNNEVKVLIGSPAIKEGMDLQQHTSDIFLLSLPYNFTQLRQIEGRGYRQGNKWKNIRINYMLTNNSIDVFMLQKLQTKQRLYDEALRSNADTRDISDIDAEELKMELITDPQRRAQLEAMKEYTRIQSQIDKEKADLAYRERNFKELAEARKKITEVETLINKYEDWAKTQTSYEKYWQEQADLSKLERDRAVKNLNTVMQRMSQKGIDIQNLERSANDTQQRITTLEAERENIKTKKYPELVDKYTKERAKDKERKKQNADDYIKQRAIDNQSFYQLDNRVSIVKEPAISVQTAWSHGKNHYSNMTHTAPSDIGKIKFNWYNENISTEGITGVERTLVEMKSLDFIGGQGDKLTGKAKLKNTDDVAFLFKNLESAANENVFAVLHRPDGTYTVLYLSTGTPTEAHIDVKQIAAAARETKASSITFVHNHPSGTLQASPQDIDFHKRLTATLAVNVNPSVIINLDSGYYSVFNTEGIAEAIKKGANFAEGNHQTAKVFHFGKQNLYHNPLTQEPTRIFKPKDVALFLSRQKRGITDKIHLIIRNNDGVVTRYLLLDKLSPGIVHDIIAEVGKHGDSVVLASNASFDTNTLNALQYALKQANITLLDAVTVKQDDAIINNYISAQEQGLLLAEPKNNNKNLENSEKSSIFAESNTNSNENRGKQYAGSRVSKTIAEAKRGVDATTKRSGNVQAAGGKQQNNEQTKRLGDIEISAKRNGTWIENIDEVALPKLLSKGFEADVYPSLDRKSVIKYNNLSVSKTIDGLIERVRAHNEFEPKAPYTIIGFGKNTKGETSVILQQPFIEGRPAPLEKVMLFLKDNSFKPAKLSTGVEGFKNDRYEISDLWKNDGSMVADNVLIDKEGNLYFIDADINFIPSEGRDILALAQSIVRDPGALSSTDISNTPNTDESSYPKKMKGETDTDYNKRRSEFMKERWKGKNAEIDALKAQLNQEKAELARIKNEKKRILKRPEHIEKAVQTLEAFTQNIKEDDIKAFVEAGKMIANLRNPELLNDTNALQLSLDETINALSLWSKKKALSDLLGIKTADRNRKGVSISGVVSDQVRKSVEYIRDKRDMTTQDINNRLDELEAIAESAEYTKDDAREWIDLGIVRLLADVREIEKSIKDLDRQIDKTNNPDNLRSMRVQQQKLLSDSYDKAIKELSDLIQYGKSELTNKRTKDLERRKAILQQALMDVRSNPISSQAAEKNKTSKERFIEALKDNKINDFMLAPLWSFNFILKFTDKNHPAGQGWNYNRFVKSKEGALEAFFKYQKGTEDVKREIINQLQTTIDNQKIKNIIKDLRTVNDKVNFTYTTHAGEEIPCRMTNDELLYIYAISKMEDVKPKLNMMRIDDAMLEHIKENLDERYMKFADWVQEDLLPRLRRERYNPVHIYLFYVSMAENKNYFPLRYNEKDISPKVGLGDRNNGFWLPSTITGSIINRVINKHELSMSSGFLDVLMEYIEAMEKWSAFAPVRSDLTILLTNKTFRNHVEANNRGMFQKFREAAEIATLSHRGQVDPSRFLSDLNRLVAAGKVSFGGFTALKQLLSLPAYIEYANNPKFMLHITRNLSPDAIPANIKWARENLPGFKQRWDSGAMGNEKLITEFWQSNKDKNILTADFIKNYHKIGLWANRAVDAYVVSLGARSIYETALTRYTQAESDKLKRQGKDISAGLPDESKAIVQRKALFEAAIAYNETQQSANPIFLSPIQVKQDAINRGLSTFQNAPFSYFRKEAEALVEWSKNKKSILPTLETESASEYFEDYMQQEGMTEEEAKRRANEDAKDEALKSINKSRIKATINLVLFGVIMQTFWDNAQRWILGLWDDKDKKKKDIATSMASSLVAGTAPGNVIQSLAQGYQGEPIMLVSELRKSYNDIKRQATKYGAFSPAAAYAVGKSISAMGGVNLDKWYSMYKAVELGVENGSIDSNNVFYFLTAPSTVRQSYASKIGDNEDLLSYARRMSEAYDRQMKSDEVRKSVQKYLYSDNGDMTRFNQAYKLAKDWHNSKNDKESPIYKQLQPISNDLEKLYQQTEKDYKKFAPIFISAGENEVPPSNKDIQVSKTIVNNLTQKILTPPPP